MSISNYGELKGRIADWLDRDDLTSYIPDFITLCQSRIRSDIETNDQEMVSTLTIDSQYNDLPASLLSLRHVDVQSTPIVELEYRTPRQMAQLDLNSTGKPKFYTMVGQQIQVYPSPDQSYTANITYVSAYTAFSNDADVNYLLTNYPGVYLYGSLLEAALFIEDDEAAQKWAAGYQGQVELVERAEQKMRYPSSGLRVTNVTRRP